MLLRVVPTWSSWTAMRQVSRCWVPASYRTSRRDMSSLPEISIYNEQTSLPSLDASQFEDTMSRLRSLLGYENYTVTLVLVDDDEMKQLNKDSRKVNAPTDILSFPMYQPIEVGILPKPEFEIPDLYTLGDMVVDVPYVMRRCQEDQKDFEQVEDATLDSPSSNGGSSDEEDEEERGVSGAMAQVFDPTLRIHMLLVHGMLHLVGYDHIKDDDYELMVAREEELLEKLGLPTIKR